ncbi:helix-turn-helix transcriptional regulator [Halofilum ochraceum]|uniref:helix-turn-helix transcriptional regulator n=1 Tax=Halofilum ochraceum TaxID=1611323 RepID=UPI000836A111|nr:helix-turn-helix transcriptional regulator [Halofilum ochraceum]
MAENDRGGVAALLDDLYNAAVEPSGWEAFLHRLSALFQTGTATVRVTDLSTPLVYTYYTVGFEERINRMYAEDGVDIDLFRDTLAAAPLGVIQASHRIVPDREFERSPHYERVFRPNGNFYAMGAHFERWDDSAMHIGVHRPRRHGPFTHAERETLQHFSPHLRRVARITRRLGEYECALSAARRALDDLPYGIWILDRRFHCRWANAPAEEAMRAGALGLGLSGERLALKDRALDGGLCTAMDALNAGNGPVQTVTLGLDGAALVLVDRGPRATSLGLPSEGSDTVLAFLVDPARPTPLDSERMIKLYAITPAEIRLLGEFMRGLDLHESAARLGISIHTARAQMKSAMQKTGVNRQPELMRKLLISATRIGADND